MRRGVFIQIPSRWLYNIFIWFVRYIDKNTVHMYQTAKDESQVTPDNVMIIERLGSKRRNRNPCLNFSLQYFVCYSKFHVNVWHSNVENFFVCVTQINATNIVTSKKQIRATWIRRFFHFLNLQSFKKSTWIV